MNTTEACTVGTRFSEFQPTVTDNTISLYSLHHWSTFNRLFQPLDVLPGNGLLTKRHLLIRMDTGRDGTLPVILQAGSRLKHDARFVKLHPRGAHLKPFHAALRMLPYLRLFLVSEGYCCCLWFYEDIRIGIHSSGILRIAFLFQQRKAVFSINNEHFKWQAINSLRWYRVSRV